MVPFPMISLGTGRFGGKGLSSLHSDAWARASPVTHEDGQTTSAEITTVAR